MAMMKRLCIVTALCPLCLASLAVERACAQTLAASSQASTTQPVLSLDDEPRTIALKAIAAHGQGGPNLWKCGHIKYTTRGGILPAMLGLVTVEDVFQFPGHLRRAVQMNDSGEPRTMVFVVHEPDAWMKAGDAPVQAIPNQLQGATQHVFGGFCDLSVLSDSQLRLDGLGPRKLRGRDTVGIRMHVTTSAPAELYFDRMTGLLFVSRRVVSSDSPRGSMIETVLDDYKNVEGMMIPTRITGTRDGEPVIDVTILDVAFSDAVDHSAFDKP
jgi:hypothetical protein